MQRSYDAWYSPVLERRMESLRFGWSGFPIVAFPPSEKRFYEYEERGTIASLASKIEAGYLQLFCVDSFDAQSWYDRGIPPAERGPRHERYDAYLRDELLPFVRDRAGRADLGLFGCSLGGYHATNFAARHPELVTKAVAFSGVYDVRRFTDGYWDDVDYRNSPADFIAGAWGDHLDRLRRVQWSIATGEYDSLIGDHRWFDAVLTARGIPHHTETWLGEFGHDWPFWNGAVARLL